MSLRPIGDRIPNVEAVSKSQGRTKYGKDGSEPHLVGKILRSPHPHARIARLDTEEARKVIGVRAVLTFSDTPGIRFGRMIDDEYILAKEKVHFIGDEVAAVAAVTEEAAINALSKIEVKYEELPATFDPESAIEPGTVLVHSGRENNIAGRIVITRGDVEEAFRGSDFIAEREYRTSLVHPAYIEPNTCTAGIDERGTLCFQMPNQSPFRTRIMLAKALGIPEAGIRVRSTAVGGGFGGKTVQRIYAICGLLALKTGQRVRIDNDHEIDFTCGVPRVPAIIRVKSGFLKNGTITAKETKIIADNGAYTITAPAVLSTMASRIDSLYRIPNIHTEAVLVYTNKLPTGMYRGFGNPQMTFAWERQMDIMSAELGMDPLEFRMLNASDAGDVTAHGWELTTCGYRETLQKGAQLSGWSKKVNRNPSGSKRRGIGVAGCIHVSGNRTVFPAYDGSSARIDVDGHGRVKVYCGESEIGQGCNTLFAQIVAHELGIDCTKIEIPEVDTTTHPFGIGTFASRVTVMGGSAVKNAAMDARRRLSEFIGRKQGVEPETIVFAQGNLTFQSEGRAHSIPFEEAVESYSHGMAGAQLMGEGHFQPKNVVLPDKDKYGNISMNYAFAAHVAEVEVDLNTGRTEVKNYWAVHDSGRVLNPMMAEGQVEGGVAQGIGYALTEEMKIVEGRVVNPTCHDYKQPTSLDMPRIHVSFVQTDDPYGPYGAKSIGEASIVPVAPAVINAVCNALGTQFFHIPLKPEAILQSLHEGEK